MRGSQHPPGPCCLCLAHSFSPLSGNFQPRGQTQGLRVVPASGDSFAASAAWARKGIEEWIGRQRCPGGSSGSRQLRAAGTVGRGTRVYDPHLRPFQPQRCFSIPTPRTPTFSTLLAQLLSPEIPSQLPLTHQYDPVHPLPWGTLLVTQVAVSCSVGGRGLPCVWGECPR